MQLKNVFITLKAANYSYLKYFSVFWPIVLLLPLVYFPLPNVLIGHPWKVELITSLLLALTLIYSVLKSPHGNNFIALPPSVVFWIVAPCSLLIFWSAASAFWAGSTSSVLHHTLVWFCYLIFFLFAIQIVSNRKLSTLSLFSLAVIIGVLATLSIIEFTLAEQITQVYGFRYARFAEMHAAVLPIFFSFVLRLKKKHLILAIVITLLIWLAILFSLSRGALFSSVIGLSVFILLRIFSGKVFAEKRRLILIAAGLILFTAIAQLPVFRSGSQNTLSRLTIQSDEDPSNSVSRNVRLLFAGVSLEMFTNNVLLGLGADNYGLKFNKYRSLFSADPKNRIVAELQEDILPERAHNEYLQILAELGVFGGVFFLWFVFGMAKLGFGAIKRTKLNQSNILTHAAMAGITAFLLSSLFSSFSFRLMQNGLIFFFLLAILLKEYTKERGYQNETQPSISSKFKNGFVFVSIFLCLSLTIFSTLKAASQYLVYRADRETEFETARYYYEKAKMLDPANAAADYSFGFRLLTENRFQESSLEIKEAVAKGAHVVSCYSYLITTQILANEFEDAKESAFEAVKIYPYSVFARVRYSSLLEKLDLKSEAANQYEIAKQLNKKQAETWWLLINEGSIKTYEKAKISDEILDLNELNPNQAMYAVIFERQTLHPEEVIKFDNP